MCVVFVFMKIILNCYTHPVYTLSFAIINPIQHQNYMIIIIVCLNWIFRLFGSRQMTPIKRNYHFHFIVPCEKKKTALHTAPYKECKLTFSHRMKFATEKPLPLSPISIFTTLYLCSSGQVWIAQFTLKLYWFKRISVLLKKKKKGRSHWKSMFISFFRCFSLTGNMKKMFMWWTLSAVCIEFCAIGLVFQAATDFLIRASKNIACVCDVNRTTSSLNNVRCICGYGIIH